MTANGNENGRADPPAPPMGDAHEVEPDVVNLQDSAEDSETEPAESALSSGTVDLADLDDAWTPFFPFEEPYQNQVDGIRSFEDTLAENGHMLMEGACGTGKTLVGLTAGVHYLRQQPTIESDRQETVPDYSRILVATPVKQQLKQFITEMRTINRQLTDHSPIDTVVMRGRQDLIPWAFVDRPPFDEGSFSNDVDDLREMTYEIIKFDSDVPLDWPDGFFPPDWSRYDYDWDQASEEAEQARENNRVDPNRAEAVVDILTDQVEDEQNQLVIGGVTSPYPNEIPQTQMVADNLELSTGDGDNRLPMRLQGRFDPFYAAYFASDRLPFWFDSAPESVMDRDALFKNAIREGVCPHESMAHLMEHAEVLIGNYMHLFDPQTRLLTDMKTGVLDEETICILDEAHNLEERVRDILSDSMGLHSLRTAIYDLEAAIGYLTSDYSYLPDTEPSKIKPKDEQDARATAQQVLDQPGRQHLTVDSFHETIELLNYLKTWLLDRSEEYLDERFDRGWSYMVENYPGRVGNETIPLEPPKRENEDELTPDVVNHFDDEIWGLVSLVTSTAEEILDSIEIAERQPECASTGSFIHKWSTESHRDYFREITLEAQQKDSPMEEAHPWTGEWTPQFQLYNCIPTTQLRAVFSEIGAGLLMSATLEPMETLIETTGLEQCIHPDSMEDREERVRAIKAGHKSDADIEFRNVRTRQYPLRFPRSNRISLAVNATKYTYSNRGDPVTDRDDMTDVREQYADLLTTVAGSTGNVMICMPSYSEARWAQDVLSETAIGEQRELFLDQSTGAAETDELLEEFFSSDEGVIITSTRSTIMEGVDYYGDRLHCCAVVGIPLVPPTKRHKAVEAAYDDVLEIDGFEATNKIPATRKARQAIGRVIRSDTEVGARILIDSRYAESGWGSVREYLSDTERSELETVPPQRLEDRLTEFWADEDM